MSKIYSIALLLFFITIGINLNAQTWQYKLSDPNAPTKDLAITAVDNGYLFHRKNDFFKFDQLGTVVSVLPKVTNSTFSSPTKIEGSNTGYVISSSPAQLRKIDFDGNTLWDFNAPTNLSLPQTVLKRLPTFLSDNGNYYFTGTDSLYVIDGINGTVLNQYSLGGNYACATIRKDNNNYCILAENLSGGFEIIQMDNSGTILSTMILNMTAYDMLVTTNSFVVVGTENGNMTLKLFDRNGSTLLSQNYGTGILYSVIQKNTDIVAAGSNGNNGKLIKVDASGNLIWSKTYDEVTSPNSRIRLINDTKNEGFLLASTSHILKTDNNGNIDTPEKDLYINGSAILDINNIKAMINADGSIFWDKADAYFKTKDTDVNSLFAGNLWIGAHDLGGNLKMAAGTYNSTGNDYQPGFIGSDAENMDKVWKISKAEIKKLRSDFDEDGVIDGIIPNDILTYPARGNSNAVGINGTSIPTGANDYLLFFDRNGDAIYNVFDGDYPLIEGDMQLTWIINDAVLHTQSQGDELYVTIVCRLYGYECGGNDLINNTVFQSYQIRNESSTPLDSLHAGVWLDGDLGCSIDDYIGSVPNKNSFFYYNKDAVDGLADGSCSGVNSYSGVVPVQSVTYLNKPLDYFNYYYRADLAPNPGMAGSQIAAEYFNFLTGTWRDGTPITYGGTGYGGTIPVNHVFSGNPTVSGDWALSNIGSTGSDFRTIGSTNLNLFQPGDIKELDIAYSLHRSLPNHTPNTNDLSNNIDNIQSLYDTDALNWDVYLGADKELTVGQLLTLTPVIEGNAGTGNYTYLWSTGATTPTINATAPITYAVTVTNTQTDCTKTDELKVKFITSTEEKVTKIDKINIFPNPATDVITIDATNLDNQSLTISIIDITGKIIKNQHFENQDLIQMEISNIPTGVYFLKFSNPQFEKIGFKKIVIVD